MAWNPSVLSWFAFASAGVLAVVAIAGWRRGRKSARTFAFIIAAVMLWEVVYGIQLGFTTKTEQLLWQRLSLAISAVVSPLFLIFALQYAGERDRLTWPLELVLAGELFAFAALSLTNPLHGLVWSDATIRHQTVSPVLDIEFGVGFFGHVLVVYPIIGLGLWTILSVYFRSTRLYRRQAALLIVGAMPAVVSHVLFTLKAGPIPGLDLTPFAFTFTGVTYGFALFYFDLLERTPVAQQRAIELTGDGLLVVDGNGIVVDANPVAEQVFDADSILERNIAAITDEADVQRLDGTTMVGSVDGARRVYDLYVSELTAGSDAHSGFAVVFRDVTDRDGYQQRLEVANRVLRHNLRNDMNVILGNADLLAERASSREQETLAESIRGAADDLVTLSEKVRQMVDLDRTAQADDERVAVDAVLEPVVSSFREAYPKAEVSVTCPGDASVAGVSERALTIAVRNLVENAGEHVETSTLELEVAVATDDNQTHISVRDNGPGLPEVEQEVLRNHTETPLHHSSGLGLWLTYWIVSTTGGEISVDAVAGEGTTVTLTFPTQASAVGAAAMHPLHSNPGQRSR